MFASVCSCYRTGESYTKIRIPSDTYRVLLILNIAVHDKVGCVLMITVQTPKRIIWSIFLQDDELMNLFREGRITEITYNLPFNS